jgi:hypothetical protein
MEVQNENTDPMKDFYCIFTRQSGRDKMGDRHYIFS